MTEKRLPSAFVCVYLILRRGDEVLLLLRKNTGYLDGQYGVVAGHVEAGESATAAMIREAKEEAGIVLTEEQLKVVHICHCQTNRTNMDIIFECTDYDGPIENREPDKCEQLAFFPLSNLPANTITYLVDVLQNIQEGKFYSEAGWSLIPEIPESSSRF